MKGRKPVRQPSVKFLSIQQLRGKTSQPHVYRGPINQLQSLSAPKKGPTLLSLYGFCKC